MTFYKYEFTIYIEGTGIFRRSNLKLTPCGERNNNMDFEDKKLNCKECSKEFVWSAGEQKFYADKGLQNPPGRCPDCRKMKKESRSNREMYSIICKECGKEGEVRFKPRNSNDVLCAECFKKSRTQTGPAESNA